MPKTLYADLTALLGNAGFVLHRQAKGSHEIWRRDSDGRQVTVPANIVSRHTANAILKQAGLRKAF